MTTQLSVFSCLRQKFDKLSIPIYFLFWDRTNFLKIFPDIVSGTDTSNLLSFLWAIYPWSFALDLHCLKLKECSGQHSPKVYLIWFRSTTDMFQGTSLVRAMLVFLLFALIALEIWIFWEIEVFPSYSSTVL